MLDMLQVQPSSLYIDSKWASERESTEDTHWLLKSQGCQEKALAPSLLHGFANTGMAKRELEREMFSKECVVSSRGNARELLYSQVS